VLEALERRDGVPGRYVEARFAWLHDLVERPDGLPSPLDELMQMLADVNQELSRLSFTRDDGFVGLADDNPLARFQRATLPASRGPCSAGRRRSRPGSSGITAEGTRDADQRPLAQSGAALLPNRP
jgi:type VI secretion system protein ImpL